MTAHTSIHRDPAWYASPACDLLIRRVFELQAFHFLCLTQIDAHGMSNIDKAERDALEKQAEDTLDDVNRILDRLDAIRTETVNFHQLGEDDEAECDAIENDIPSVADAIKIVRKAPARKSFAEMVA